MTDDEPTVSVLDQVELELAVGFVQHANLSHQALLGAAMTDHEAAGPSRHGEAVGGCRKTVSSRRVAAVAAVRVVGWAIREHRGADPGR
jgi:hypothetical protein